MDSKQLLPRAGKPAFSQLEKLLVSRALVCCNEILRLPWRNIRIQFELAEVARPFLLRPGNEARVETAWEWRQLGSGGSLGVGTAWEWGRLGSGDSLGVGLYMSAYMLCMHRVSDIYSTIGCVRVSWVDHVTRKKFGAYRPHPVSVVKLSSCSVAMVVEKVYLGLNVKKTGPQ